MAIRFADRLEAARALARALDRLRGSRVVVAGIPRGAVPMAAEIARALDADLDVALVHKVGHPRNPEYAVAAVDESGELVRTDDAELPDAELARLAAPEVKRLRERRRQYDRIRPSVPVEGRVVVIVDDGLATGATMLAAVRSARARGAERVIAAAPVGSAEAVERIRREADEVVVLSVPPDFAAVGLYYDRFEPVTDDEVLAALGAQPLVGSSGP